MRRGRQLGLRLTAAEAEAARAGAYGRRAPVYRANCSRCSCYVRQDGVCLNQVARRLHAGAPVVGEDLRSAP